VKKGDTWPATAAQLSQRLRSVKSNNNNNKD
jgi:hypothetical protein